MLKPIRDLNKNFAVSLDVLEKYIAEVRQISIDTINFANAGLILQVCGDIITDIITIIIIILSSFF